MDGLLFAGKLTNKELIVHLDSEGFETDLVGKLPELRKYIIEKRPRMILICSDPVRYIPVVREIDTHIPVLVLGDPKSDSKIEEASLRAGADCFLSAPISASVLSAWIAATFRRLEKCPFGQERYHFADVEVDVFRRTVTNRGWRIMMSATEFDLLVHLIRNNGRVVSRDEILREVWKYDTCPTTRTVDNFICKLRRKIEGEQKGPSHLKTVKGTGYRFDLELD